MSRIKYNQEQIAFEKVLKKFSKDVDILDVGCGTGRNLEKMQQLGFKNLVGVDISLHMVDAASSKGFECYPIDEFNNLDKKYDLILMSHAIEHFNYEDLKSFMESYLLKLNTEGRLIIMTPVLQNSFYNDFDHVKLYLPIGIDMVFGENQDQVQIKSNTTLKLEDLYFCKDQLRVCFSRLLYLKEKSLVRLINMFLKLISTLTRGIVGITTGWVGVYLKVHK